MQEVRQVMQSLPKALREGSVEGVAQALRLETGRSGPHAVVVALLHGNETCGLAALRAVLRRRGELRRGRVTLLAANVAGFARRRPEDPQAGRFVEADMNRLWSPEGMAAASLEALRAREVAPLFRDADLVLDLHSMATPGPRLLMFHDTPAARALLPALPPSLHRIRFARPLHQGRLLIEQPTLLGDPDRAAFVVECGPHRAPASAAFARAVTLRALAAAGLLPAVPPPRGRTAPDIMAMEMLQAETDDFRFLRPPEALHRFERGEVIAEDGGRAIRAPFATTWLLLPRARPRRGQEAGLLGYPAND